MVQIWNMYSFRVNIFNSKLCSWEVPATTYFQMGVRSQLHMISGVLDMKYWAPLIRKHEDFRKIEERRKVRTSQKNLVGAGQKYTYRKRRKSPQHYCSSQKALYLRTGQRFDPCWVFVRYSVYKCRRVLYTYTSLPSMSKYLIGNDNRMTHPPLMCCQAILV